MKTVLTIIVLVVVYGIVSTTDYKSAKLEEASAICQNQTNFTTPTLAQCIDNQLEKNNDK